MLEMQLDPELGRRLEHVYKLSRRPHTLGDLRDLFEAKREDPEVAAYVELLQSGRAVIGASSGGTPYANILAEGEIAVMCGYDALMNALYQGGGDIKGVCVHCDETMAFTLSDDTITERSHPAPVFWLGTGPIGAPGNPVCDHLHLFPDRSHLAGWLGSHPDALGVAMTLDEAIAFFKDRPLPPAFARRG